ncbi:hypothetical protein [Rhodococcus sp. IEGM 1379]|uniref:hypothetical protein n=1 Tax=Rhodococcus sp. IEGM 1379 TaxID=3047086 RepID=UPI0024B6C965|nr:hypothetical protein [Rhodococcus sp. IEGM 1379]MDI9914401.1 hypothetical protein [Rhodococcus sp. IEGM 1379]
MSVNEELLRSVMSHIETWPNLLDSTKWRCGTSRCFAGWTAELSGATWLYDSEDMGAIEIDGHHELRYAIVSTPAGRVQHVEYYATEMLGISEDAAEQLFDGDTTVSELREMVNNLCDFGTVYDAAPKTQAEVTAP